MSASVTGPETIARRVVISGRVQGVGFRASTSREAIKFPGLRGYVRNLPNGDLEVLAQGTASAVEAMIEWCYAGPPDAEVENVQVTEVKIDPALPHFTIRKD